MSPGTGKRPDPRNLHLSNAKNGSPIVNDHNVEFQWEVDCDQLPSEPQILQWVRRTLNLLEEPLPTEIAIRVVSEHEMAELNERYRHKSGPTNVLAFPVGVEDEERRVILGDLVLCADVVVREAARQNKSLEAHFAHMIVHGLLHLKGHDHVEQDEAVEMEGREVRVMGELGFSNPYETGERRT